MNVADLAIKVSLGSNMLSDHLNLNYKTNVGTDFETMSRIASIDLAEGVIPDHATVIVDIDVYTSNIFTTKDVDVVKKWVIEAHDHEKVAFFDILGEKNANRLQEA